MTGLASTSYRTSATKSGPGRTHSCPRPRSTVIAEAPIRKNGRSIVVNLGLPKILLGAIMQATYKPVMQAPYDAAVKAAVNRTPDLMEEELRDAIEYRASRGGMHRMGAGT